MIQGVYMTPSSVSSALRMAELGYMSRYCDLLSECREKVSHLQATLSLRELAIASCEWEMTPKDHGTKRRKSKKALEISDYVSRRIEEIPEFGEAIQHLMGGVYFGRSALEKEYGRDSDGVMIKALYPIHPKRLSYAVNWRLHLWDENGNEYDSRLGNFPGVDILAEFPDKFIVHTPNTMGVELATRQGLGRVLVWYALFWSWSQRDWMKFAELFGQPWRVAFYDKATADQDDVAIIKQALAEMSSATSAVLPSTTHFDIKMPSGRSTVHEALRNALNAEISKVVLGQTLTTEVGSTGGNRALGQVHNEVRMDIKNNDGRSISETIQRGLVEPLVRAQFGAAMAREFCPTFRLITRSEEDINMVFKRAIAAVDRGVPIAVDDLRERFTGLPRPENPKPGDLCVPLAKAANMPDLPIDPDAPPRIDPLAEPVGDLQDNGEEATGSELATDEEHGTDEDHATAPAQPTPGVGEKKRQPKE